MARRPSAPASDAAAVGPVERARFDAFATVFLLAQQLTRQTDEKLAAFELTTSQWLLLAVLSRRFPDGAPTLGEAAAAFGSSRQNTRQLARQLEHRGYLELRADPDDRRALRLHLTRRVKRFERPATVADQLEFMAGVFSCFDDDEVRRLEAMLRRWLTSLDHPPR